MGDSLFAALSPETTGIVLLSAVSTLRSVPGLPDLTAVKPSLVQPQDSAARSGSYVVSALRASPAAAVLQASAQLAVALG